MLSFEEVGLIYNFLLKKRIARSYYTTNITSEERYIANLLEKNIHALDDLDDFLRSQSLKLEIFSAQQYNLSENKKRIDQGNAFVIYPTSEEVEIKPAHLRVEQLWEGLKDGARGDKKFVSVVWGAYFYLQLLNFLYTQENRPIEGISMYSDTWVIEDDFATRVTEELESLRSGIKEEGDIKEECNAINNILLNASITEIQRRISKFFKAMVRFRILEQRRLPDKSQIIYVQTLWSAVDIARNFHRNSSLIISAPDAKSIKTFTE